MIRFWTAILVSSSFITAQVHATPEDYGGIIRVRLTAISGGKPFKVGITGKAQISEIGGTGRVGKPEALPLTFSLQKGRVACSPLHLASATGLRLEPESGGTIQIGKRTYRGALEILKEGKGLLAINEVEEEDYVFGSLLPEGSASMKPEATKALAVAIRTYAARSKGKHSGGLFDLCDTTHCQGYVGIRTSKAEWARYAQETTAGQVLTWEDKPIWAAYSTNCGGFTANNEDGGFGQIPLTYLRGSVDRDEGERAFCSVSSVHRWVKEIPLARLEKALNRQKATRVGRVTNVTVERTDRFGRALTVRIEGEPASTRVTNTKIRTEALTASAFTLAADAPMPPAAPALPRVVITRSIKATTLRSMLGVSVLKSTFFNVSRVGDALLFEGRGYGHGVGMCISGANGMANAGFTYEQILARYYSGASLVQRGEVLPE